MGDSVYACLISTSDLVSDQATIIVLNIEDYPRGLDFVVLFKRIACSRYKRLLTAQSHRREVSVKQCTKLSSNNRTK